MKNSARLINLHMSFQSIKICDVHIIFQIEALLAHWSVTMVISFRIANFRQCVPLYDQKAYLGF